MAYQINYAYLSHTGKVRLNNEDNFWCNGDYLPAENKGSEGVRSGTQKLSAQPVFGVFDGMGGESSGEIAAFLSAETCGKWYNGHKRDSGKKIEDFWMELCTAMNRAVCDYARENKIYTMGTTAAMLLFERGVVHACNLGDSRVYELRNGVLEMISEDHVFRRNLFGKAPLLQYVGIPEDHMALEPTIRTLEIKEGLRYLICSDGVTDMLSEEEIRNLMVQNKTIEEVVEEICDRSLRQGGRDNITIILCEVTEEKSRFQSWLDKCRKGFKKGDV